MAVFQSQLLEGRVIEACRVHVLTGPSQLKTSAEPQFKDSEELTLPHLLISDPLQDARELKEKQDELIALQNAGLESQQTGQLGLAQMIQELTANGDPLELEEHLASERYDQQLQIGRASCRERVYIAVVAGSVKRKRRN